MKLKPSSDYRLEDFGNRLVQTVAEQDWLGGHPVSLITRISTVIDVYLPLISQFPSLRIKNLL